MSLSILTWNINGLRAAITKNFWDKMNELKPDIICLQEIKTDDLTMKTLIQKDENFANWQLIWHSAIRKGYSGTMILINKEILEKKTEKESPNLPFQPKSEDIFDLEEIQDLENYDKKIQKLNSEIKSFENKEIQSKTQSNQIKILEQIVGIDNEVFDVEGRTTGLIFELKFNLENVEEISKENQTFLLLNCYYPQGGRGIERIEYKLAFYKEVLEFARQKKLEFTNLQIILTGDFNTTFGDIDLKRPKENRQTTGCLAIERQVLNLLCAELDLLDIFREFNPELQLFTYWDQITRARERNVGWRIDFFLTSKELMANLKNNFDKKHLDRDNYKSKPLELKTINPSKKLELEEEGKIMSSDNLAENEQTKNEQTKNEQNTYKINKIEILNEVFGSDHCPVWLEII